MRHVSTTCLMAAGLTGCGPRPRPVPPAPTPAEASEADGDAEADADADALRLRGIFLSDQPPTPVGRLAIRLVRCESFTRVPAERVFTAGEAIRFEVGSNVPARLTILHATGDDALVPIWPPADRPDLGRLAAGATAVVPPAPTRVVFDRQPGVERFRLVLTAEAQTRRSTAADPAAGSPPTVSQIYLRSGEVDARIEQTASGFDEGYLYFEARDGGQTAAIDIALAHR